MTFVNDTFTDASGTLLQNHVGEVGATWTKHPNSLGAQAIISSAGRIYSDGGTSTSTDALYLASGVPATAEYDVEFDTFYVTTTATLKQAGGATARHSPTANTFYMARLTMSALELYKRVAGTFTLLGSYSIVPVAGQTYRIKLEIRNAAKKVYLDGVERISSTDNSITEAGRVGWRSYQGADNTSGGHNDNLVATDVPEFVKDTFTDVSGTFLKNHIGEVGATWARHLNSGGEPTISNANRVRSDAASDNQAYASGLPATAEYDVEHVVHFVSVASGQNWTGACGRMATDANTFYLARLSHNSLDLLKRVGGTFTSLGAYAFIPVAGQSYTIKLEIRDAAKKVYLDGVERISSADNSITAAGRVGVRPDPGMTDTTGSHIDSITASNPVAAVSNDARIFQESTEVAVTGQITDARLYSENVEVAVGGQITDARVYATSVEVAVLPGAPVVPLTRKVKTNSIFADKEMKFKVGGVFK